MAIAIFAAISFTSCDDDEGSIVWDFTPVTVKMDVVDAQGNDLLDPDTSGNLLESGITATFCGKDYDIVDPRAVLADAQSRAILAMFYGLYIED